MRGLADLPTTRSHGASDDVDDARLALLKVGYRPSQTIYTEDGHVHDTPLVHPDGIVSVELHRELTTRVLQLSGCEVVADSQHVTSGLRMPSAQHRIIHNVIHAQIINGGYVGGSASFRDTLDLARLVCAHFNSIDWTRMADTARQRGYFRELSGALHNAARFVGSPLPEAFSGDRGGRNHAMRCSFQRRFPVVDTPIQKLGTVVRALAWERDAYALGLGNDRDWAAHLKVNIRRARRIGKALQRNFHW